MFLLMTALLSKLETPQIGQKRGAIAERKELAVAFLDAKVFIHFNPTLFVEDTRKGIL
jgi:hypothetical protein